MEQISRRDFFSRKVLGQVWRKSVAILPISEGMQEKSSQIALTEPELVPGESDRTVMSEYFSSPLYSYALLSEMPWDMLIKEAKRLGIEYEGRSKLDVVREVFMGKSATETEG